MYMACRIAKQGYFNGDPIKVLKAPVNIVINIIHFEVKQNEYETYVMEMNK